MKTMINPIKVLFFLYAIKCAYCDSCVTYNFEESFDELFSAGEMCASMGAEGEWTLGNFSSTSVVHPFSDSTSFLSPDTTPSCTSSFTFPISDGGILEVNVYMDAEVLQASIQIFVNRVEEDGIDSIVGAFSLSPTTSSYQRGWNTLTHTIISTKVYNGYVTLIATSAEGSMLFVDSFRYIPRGYEIEDCIIYTQEEDSVPEEEPKPDSCVTYTFENSFNDLFSNSRWCTNMPGAEGDWTLGNYSLSSIEKPHPASTSFISPSTIMSCTSSFTFPMSNGGTFELNVYMTNEPSNQLLVFVNEIVEEGNDNQAAATQLSPNLAIYQEGWNSISVNLTGIGTYEGYVTLVALAAEGSNLLVDSFRYIPPSYEIDNCEIYSEEAEPDETNPGQNTTEENNSNETTESYPNTTEENDTNQTEDIGGIDSHTCVTYDFENNFDEVFSYSRMCITAPASEEWTIGNYSLTSIETPHPASRSFISPAAIMSCTSSFTFLMSNNGTFEVNVYMDGNDVPNQLLVFVNQLVEGEDNTPVANLLLSPNLDTYVKGWNTLTATLGGTGTYEGYVTFMGAVAGESILLVDSFRYIPPEYDIEACVIYSQDSEPDELGTTTTTETTLEVTTESDSNWTEENNSSQTEADVTTASPETEVTDENEVDVTTESNVTEGNETTEIPQPEVTDAPDENEVDETTESNVTEENETTETPQPEVTDAPDENEVDETTESNVTEENVTTEFPGTEEGESNVDTDGDSSTEAPDNKPGQSSSFWNPFTIAMVVVLSLIAFALFGLCFYECGKRRAQDRRPLVYTNYDDAEVPPEMRVPRVNKVYSEPRVMAY